MTNETEIDETIAPPAMGSMKGLVENSFLVYQKKLQNLGRGYGVIYHEYQSKHYETACMMLEDIKRDIEDFIIEFNQKEREALITTKEMVRKEIIALPYKLWQFWHWFRWKSNLGNRCTKTEAVVVPSSDLYRWDACIG